MNILNEVKAKSNIDIDLLMTRLKKELSISEDNQDVLEYALFDTMIIILDVTHQEFVVKELYATWINMIKDYWYLNKYDELGKKTDMTEESQNETIGEIKAISQGNEKVEFYEKGKSVDINGIRYNTGTIEFDTNLLREKYKADLYRHRKMRW